jgi:hypothetical protein
MEIILILARLYLFVVAALFLWLVVECVEMFASQDARDRASQQRYREERLLAAKIVILSPVLPLWLMFRLFWTPAPRMS